MKKTTGYTLENFGTLQTEELKRYIEAQYHIRNEGLIKARRALLDEKGCIANEPYLETGRFYKSVKRFDADRIGSIGASLLNRLSEYPSQTGVMPTPYTHQIDALEAFCKSGKNIVVATGTGSGKTESFLYPLLVSLIALEKKKPTQSPSTKALILYPMNALVLDQTTRLRKILGSDLSKSEITAEIGRPLRFGNYTGSTPYPGVPSLKKNKENIEPLKELFKVDALPGDESEYRNKLVEVNRTPAKADLKNFFEKLESSDNFSSIIAPNDPELIFRGEMQACPPDVMVTNYSMLEYMLLRPIEQNIFDQTKLWLEASPENFFTIILDEAHMYTGTTGSEVSLLLRRFVDRIGARKGQIRFIVTSASLGEEEEKICEVAEKLTGESKESYTVIYDQTELSVRTGQCDNGFSQVLNHAPLEDLHRLYSKDYDPKSLNSVQVWVDMLSEHLKVAKGDATSETFKQWLGEVLLPTPVFGLARDALRDRPRTPTELTDILFPRDLDNRADLLNKLIGLGALAQAGSNLLLPIRAHFMYRGLPGLYVCANPACGEVGAPVGRMYAEQRSICEDCGSRVFELHTHRTCGSAFIKGYWNVESDNYTDVTLHPTRSSLDSHALEPVYLCVDEHSPLNSEIFSINPRTGKISNSKNPSFLSTTIPFNSEDFQALTIKNFSSTTTGWTYKKCPCCNEPTVKSNESDDEGEMEFESSIMDLATKGEDPFSYLVREQFKLQPASNKQNFRDPNQGRKVLLFSDGRQKAARIAKTLPERLQADLFRAYILKAYLWLQSDEAKEKLCGEDGLLDVTRCTETLNPVVLYHGLLEICSAKGTHFFEGQERLDFAEHLERYAKGKPVKAKKIPESFFQMLANTLCSRHYNLTDLAIAGVQPSERSLNQLVEDVEEEFGEDTYSKTTLRAFVAKRMRDYLAVGAIDGIESKVLRDTLGPVYGPEGQTSTYKLNPRKGYFSSRQADRLFGHEEAKKINQFFAERFLEEKNGNVSNKFELDITKIALSYDDEKNWYECSSCLFLTDLLADENQCPACGSDADAVTIFDPDTPYFRARKLFWRNPVKELLENQADGLFIDVGEHTAQLNYKDNAESIIPTVARNELRFQGLLDPADHLVTKPLDILSSTTTMEVGIDIGGLIAVGMRNVPPQRQNYQQRAGRAGRRGSAFSTVVTYCQNSSHDSHYFKNPSQIINGEMAPVHVEPVNKSLAKRHLLSSVLGSYFRQDRSRTSSDTKASNNIFEHLGLIEDFVGPTEPCMTGLKKWIELAENKSKIRTQNTWYSKLFREEDLERDLEHLLNDLEPKLIQVVDHLKTREQNRGSDNKLDVRLMDVLFDQGYLPAYAFPKDLVNFEIFETRKNIEVKETSSYYIGSALSEAAPGRILVIDKNTYQISSILGESVRSTTRNKAREIFSSKESSVYRYCNSCGRLTDDREQPRDCCNEPTIEKIKVVQPKYVVSKPPKSTKIELRDAIYTQAMQPQIVGDDFTGVKKTPHKRLACSNVTYRANGVRFAHINANGNNSSGTSPNLFTVCTSCGKSSPPYSPEAIREPHDRDYPTREKGILGYHRCGGQQVEKVAIGHEIVTDMSAIEFSLPDTCIKPVGQRLPPELEIACTSLNIALVQSFSKQQDIDERDVGYGCRVAVDESHDVELYFFDDAQGGAGYASQLVPSFFEILKGNKFYNALAVLESCVCDSSCYKCLSSYQNRFIDSSLNRFLGSSLARTLLTGELTQDGDEKYLRSLTQRLLEEIKQVGGTVIGERSFVLGNEHYSFEFIPSLSCKSELQGKELLLRPIDIALRLPNVMDILLK